MISDSTCIYNYDKIVRQLKLLQKMSDDNVARNHAYDDGRRYTDYNLRKMVYYTCKGYDLIGSTANTRDPRRHFLVKNNHYDVYEIPHKSNRGLRMTGEFMVLIYNIDFDVWYWGYMIHKFIRNKQGVIEEKVQYFIYGEFRFSMCGQSINVACTCAGGKNCRGIRGNIFDSDNLRKEKAYHTTYKVINRHYGNRNLR